MQNHTNLDIAQLRARACADGLRGYVVQASGGWTDAADDDAVRLSGDDDAVTFAGPLDLTVAVEAANVFAPVRSSQANGSDCGCQHTELWSYEVSVPAGHTWSYDSQELTPYRVGTNRGCRVVIRRRRARKVTPTQSAADLPCDFAVENLADTGSFFPSACEPCGDRPVRAPTPECGPRIDVPIASGGCVRPRYFNGMAIAREDLETELRYLRLKLRLHNRAAGTGVVWGFDTSLRGSRIVVGPGYGVDCCGNDLTVTCDYAVDAQALLRDPAICRAVLRGADCFALLLEFVECPQDPRPVHGNGCRPQAVDCEYSRVRESVRLRLVPTRKPAESPLALLVSELLPAPPTTVTTTSTTAAPTWQPASAGTVIPWQLRLTNKGGTKTVRPRTDVAVIAELPAEKPGGEMLKIEVLLDNGIQTQAGTLTLDTHTAAFSGALPTLLINQLTGTTTTGSIVWQTANGLTLRGNVTVQTVYMQTPDQRGKVREPSSATTVIVAFTGNQPAPGTTVLLTSISAAGVSSQVVGKVVGPSGASTTVSVANSAGIRQGSDAIIPSVVTLRVTLPASAIEVATAPPTPVPTDLPCCAGSCCAPDDGTTLAQRLKLLLAALFYGKLVQNLAAKRAAGAQTDSDRAKELALARALLAYLAQALGLKASSLAILEDKFAELYRAWCAAGIYDGPVCREPIDGVVIGCVTLKAGAICAVDPLGGRRWVVHQPLIDHWGAQFGIAALDLTVSGVFSKLCCLSHLPGFGELLPPSDGNNVNDAGLSSHYSSNYGRMRAEILDRRDDGTPVSAEPAPAAEAASATMMAMLSGMTPRSATATAGLSQAATGATTNAGTATVFDALGKLQALDLPAVAVLVQVLFCPDDAGAQTKPSNATANAATAVKAERLGQLVDNSMNRVAMKRQARPLMRTASSDLAKAVAALVPASAVVAANSPLHAALSTAAITTVADLAAQPPEILHAAAGDAAAPAIDEAVAKAEDLVELAVATVSEATRALASKGLSSPRDLDKPEIAERLAKEIATRMAKNHVTVDAAALTKAVLALKR